MRDSRCSMLLALALVATTAGCRCTCDGPLGHYDWALCQSHAATDCPPPELARAGHKCPPGAKLDTVPPQAVSIDAPATSELVPLPTRPVFGSRMDGRQAGIVEPASADEPAAELIPAPPPSPATSGTSLKLRRNNPPLPAVE
ncbi:MAG TPA: hypothetical protein VHV55_10965 [Pirellulales bacterium]|nr:hypothetical protein [Pirellulales bacterium]